MRKLIFKLVVFLLPLAGLLAFPVWVFGVSGEWRPVEDLVRTARGSRPVLIEPAHTDLFGYFKLRSVQERKPEVVSLGSSRVMQFRADFFDTSFFNAGFGGIRLEGYRQFIERLAPGDEPGLLILGLDQRFFNPRFTLPPREFFEDRYPGSNWIVLTGVWHRIYRDWWSGKFRIADLTGPQAWNDGTTRIGLGALSHDAGFRNDGSHHWYWWESHDKDLKDIAGDRGSYIRSKSISEKSLAEIEALLLLCRARGIQVAGFLPPFSPQVHDALKREAPEYAYIFELADRLRPLFDRQGFVFEDFTDPYASGIDRDGFFDGEHASEKAYRRLWERWSRKEPFLGPYRRGPDRRSYVPAGQEVLK